MEDTFDIGDTIVAAITVKRDSVLVDPATFMKIEVTAVGNATPVIALTDMTKDSTGTYHHDISTTSYVAGFYQIKYVSTDTTRVTVGKDRFKLV